MKQLTAPRVVMETDPFGADLSMLNLASEGFDRDAMLPWVPLGLDDPDSILAALLLTPSPAPPPNEATDVWYDSMVARAHAVESHAVDLREAGKLFDENMSGCELVSTCHTCLLFIMRDPADYAGVERSVLFASTLASHVEHATLVIYFGDPDELTEAEQKILVGLMRSIDKAWTKRFVERGGDA